MTEGLGRLLMGMMDGPLALDGTPIRIIKGCDGAKNYQFTKMKSKTNARSNLCFQIRPMQIWFAGLLFLSFTLCQSNAEIASWYGDECRGKPTANQEKFNPDGFTCASWTLKFGQKVRVTGPNGSVIVRCNDRGPAKRLHRDIDLSRAAFEKIAPLKQGLANVKIEILK